MQVPQARIFYLNPSDWTWWVWLATAILLTIGLLGVPIGFLVAIILTLVQTVVILSKERNVGAFPVQLRVAYLGLLIVCYLPAMRWLYWLPAVGTFALVIFGYCLMARCLSLLPWNSSESYSLNRLRRTFFSSPDLSRVPVSSSGTGCAGGMCTIEAQVIPPEPHTEQGSGGNG